MATSTQTPVIHGFSIQATIGAGSGGTVYRAFQVNLGREVALKVLREPLGNANLVRRFRQEARALGRISHPGIVRIFEFDGDGPFPYIAMELFPGGSLREKLNQLETQARRLSLQESLQIARDLLLALAVLHDAGLLHRDIKPSNILLRESGDAVLGDLGLVKALGNDVTHMTRVGDLVGTAAYIAPELWGGAPFSVRTDIFAVGLILYEMLTGQHPTSYLPLSSDFVAPDPRMHWPEAPGFVVELVKTLLTADPNGRPATARDAVRLLGESIGGRVELPPPPVVRPRTRRPVIVAFLVAFLLLSLLFVALKRRYTLEVRAGSEDVGIVVRTGYSGLSVTVSDESGSARTAYPQTLKEGGISFQIDQLRPGRNYTANLHAQGSKAVLATCTFQTQPAIRLIGIDRSGADVALWLSCDPPAEVRQGGGPFFHVGTEGSRVRLAVDAADPALDVQFQSGSSGRIQLATTLLRTEAAHPLKEIGIGVGRIRGPIHLQVDGKEVPVEQWMHAEGMEWISPTVDEHVSPSELRIFLRHILQAYKIQALIEFQTPHTLALARSVTDPGILTNAKSLGILSLYHMWSRTHDDMEWPPPPGVATLNENQIDEFVRECVQSPDIETPLSLASIMDDRLLSASELTILKHRKARCAIAQMGWDSLKVWRWVVEQYRRTLKNGDACQDLRWLWIFSIAAPLVPGQAPYMNPIRYANQLAHTYTLARSFFREAVIMLRLAQLIHPSTRIPTLAWHHLRAVGRAISGLNFKRMLTPQGTPPRVDDWVDAFAFANAGETRRAQILFARNRPGRATFTPGAPGVLTQLGNSDTETQVSSYTTLKPISIEIGDSPTIYREFSPVSGSYFPGRNADGSSLAAIPLSSAPRAP